jgi:hypothetical protein
MRFKPPGPGRARASLSAVPLLLLLACGSAAAQPALTPAPAKKDVAPREFIVPAPDHGATPIALPPGAVKAGRVKVDLDVLDSDLDPVRRPRGTPAPGLPPAPPRAMGEQLLVQPLAIHPPILIVIDRRDPSSDGVGRTYTGHVVGDGGPVVIARRGAMIAVDIHEFTTGRVWQLPPREIDFVALLRDAKLLPAEADLVAPHMQKKAQDLRITRWPPPPGPAQIDVLVLHTMAVRKELGGDLAVATELDLRVAQANLVFMESAVQARIRAWPERSAFDEATLLTNLPPGVDPALDPALQALKNAAVPFEGVPDLRNEHGADLVSLWIAADPFEVDACGIGSVLTSLTQRDPRKAYSVVPLACLQTKYSFLHEIGHNLGGLHDRPNAGQSPSIVRPYAYGFGDQAGGFCTIMAAAFPGPDGLQRIGYFSNPRKSHQGRPLGVPSTEPDSADNASVLNETAPFVATYRDPVHAPDYAFTLVEIQN